MAPKIEPMDEMHWTAERIVQEKLAKTREYKAEVARVEKKLRQVGSTVKLPSRGGRGR